MDNPISIKERYLAIINNEWQGILPGIIKIFFFILSCLYRIVLSCRSKCYNAGILKSTKLSVPVISVGNITLGGVGKTPFVELIAKYLKTKNKKVAILSRGYGAKKRKNNSSTKIIEYNDEHLVLSENLEGVPNIINSNRALGGKIAIEKHNVDCLLLDDGFQHLKLKRSLDIVIINSLNPFGFENVIPRGFLREPLKNIERANLFIITHTNLCTPDEIDLIRNRLKSINNRVPIIESIHHPLQIEELGSETTEDVSWLSGKKIYSLSAIGCPESFSKSLIKLEAVIVKSRIFPDHHLYTNEELENVINEAKQLGVDTIITTQKDKVKMVKTLNKRDKTSKIPIKVLKIEAKVVRNMEAFEKLLDKVTYSSNE